MTRQTVDEPLILLSRQYDRTAALVDGRVSVGGRRTRIEVMDSPPATFKRLSTDHNVVAGEMSFGFHTAAANTDSPAFVGVPVFLSRSFRHGNVFVRKDSSLDDFSQLAGHRIGLEEYAMTMAVWVRALLDDAGIRPEQIHWHTARSPVVAPEVEARLQQSLNLNRVEPGSLWKLLEAGEIDAVIGRPPDFHDVYDGPFRRLLRDHWQVQRSHFQSTGIFPIMHVLVVRRDAYEADPAIAMDLYDAFTDAKRLAIEDLRTNLNTLCVTLPMLEAHVEETDALFGPDWWPYGVTANRTSLETFVIHSLRQGLITSHLEIDQLFCAETLST